MTNYRNPQNPPPKSRNPHGKKRNPTPTTKSTATPPKLIIEIHQHWTEFGKLSTLLMSYTVNAGVPAYFKAHRLCLTLINAYYPSIHNSKILHHNIILYVCYFRFYTFMLFNMLFRYFLYTVFQKKHPLMLSSISPWKMFRFKPNFQGMFMMNKVFHQRKS